jgi:hypothetical protein
MSKKDKKLQSPAMLAVLEARKEGCFTRSKCWGKNEKSNRQERKNTKNQIKKGDF